MLKKQNDLISREELMDIFPEILDENITTTATTGEIEAYNEALRDCYHVAETIPSADAVDGRNVDSPLEVAELKQATTAISTLQAENAQLRDELEREKQFTACYEHLTDMGLEASKKLLANLEKLKSERDTLRYFFEDVANKPDCNTCANKNCEYRPRVGQTTRFNCPLWNGTKEEK